MLLIVFTFISLAVSVVERLSRCKPFLNILVHQFAIWVFLFVVNLEECFLEEGVSDDHLLHATSIFPQSIACLVFLSVMYFVWLVLPGRNSQCWCRHRVEPEGLCLMRFHSRGTLPSSESHSW